MAGEAEIIPAPVEFQTSQPTLTEDKVSGTDPSNAAEQLRREEALLEKICKATQQARGLELMLQTKWQEVASLTAEFDRLVREEQQKVSTKGKALELAVRPFLMLQDLKQVGFSAQPSSVLAGAKPTGFKTVGELLSDSGPASVVNSPVLSNPENDKVEQESSTPPQIPELSVVNKTDQEKTTSEPGSELSVDMLLLRDVWLELILLLFRDHGSFEI